MTTRTRTAVLGLFAALTLTTSARADFKLDVKVGDLQLGKPLSGPALTADDLKDKVVLVNYWGVRCPRCAAQMPTVARWNDELGGAGLVVIGIHAQGGDADAARAKARAFQMNFAVVESGSVKGADDWGLLPHALLFDHTGKCVFRGASEDAGGRVREAVGAALAAGLGKARFSPAVTPLVDALKKGQSPPLVLRKALPLLKSSNAATAEEAKLLVGNLSAIGQKQIDAAEALKKDDPLAAHHQLQRVSADYKGTAVAVKAGALLKELVRDPAVSAELKARPTLESVRKLDAQLQKALDGGDPKAAAFQRTYAAPLRQLQTYLKQMKKTAPTAKATEEALAIGEKYGVGSK